MEIKLNEKGLTIFELMKNYNTELVFTLKPYSKYEEDKEKNYLDEAKIKLILFPTFFVYKSPEDILEALWPSIKEEILRQLKGENVQETNKEAG